MSDVDAADAPTYRKQHLRLREVTPEHRRWLRSVEASLRDAGWSRMSPVFALPMSSGVRTVSGQRVPESVRLGTSHRLSSNLGDHDFTIRTVGLDFDLIGGRQLAHRRASLVFSIGDALSGQDLMRDVLLADACIPRSSSPQTTLVALEVIRAHFKSVRVDERDFDADTIRVKVAAWVPITNQKG